MTKNIHVLKLVFVFCSGTIFTDFVVTRDHGSGPYSQEFMLKVFEEHPDETIVCKYTYKKGIFSRCAGIMRGDLSDVFSLGGWMVKKAWSYVVIPSIVTYCFTGYIVYRAYKIIRYFDSLFPALDPVEEKKNESQDALLNDIDRLLYRKISHAQKIRRRITKREMLDEKQHLYCMLQRYRALSRSLELTGIRNLFWYNSEYERKIADLIPLLEDSLSLPNLPDNDILIT